MDAHKQQVTVSEIPRPAPVNWGALFGGLVFSLAAGWLLGLFGTAVGFSVADGTDLEAVGEGLGMGTVLWFAFSWLVAYFLGALLTARLSGATDETDGMLQGAALWGLATVTALVLGMLGLGGLIGAGTGVASSGAETARVIVGGVGSQDGEEQGGGGIGEMVSAALSSDLARTIETELKKEAGKVVSEASGGAVGQDEAQQAVQQIDAQTLQKAAGQLATGDTEAARKTLADNTELSEQDIDALVEGVSGKIENQWQDVQDSALVQNVKQELRAQADAALAELAEVGGSRVDEQELRRAVAEIDTETLTAAGEQLLLGNPEAAKQILVRDTNLSEQEVEAIVSGVQQRVREQVQELRAEVEQVAEEVSDYVEALLWLAFVGAALGLGACLGGGALGAGTNQRVYAMRARERHASA